MLGGNLRGHAPLLRMSALPAQPLLILCVPYARFVESGYNRRANDIVASLQRGTSRMADNLNRYYETLGLRPGASPKEIRRAYLDLTKVWHPDRFGEDTRLKKRAEAQLREINSAYEHLRAAHQARAAKRSASRQAGAAALGMPEIMALLILVAVLAVLAVIAVACHQLTSSPAATLLAAGLA